MKLRNILGLAAASTILLATPLLTSCDGNKNADSIRHLGDYKNATEADSLIYYFGQLRAVDYWQYAQQDSVLKTRESRDQYIKGLKAGLDAANDNDAYNQGLFVGIQLAMNMKEFQEGYDCKFDRKILLNAIEDGLINDSIVDAGEANAKFREIHSQLNEKKEAADREKAIAALAKDAAEQKWVKINDNLYAAPTALVASDGKKMELGDFTSAEIEIATLEGRVIDIRPTDAFKVGNSYPGPITDAVLTMKENEKRSFYTTAPAVMGRYYERYNLKPDQILKVTIKLGNAGPAPTSTPPSED